MEAVCTDIVSMTALEYFDDRVRRGRRGLEGGGGGCAVAARFSAGAAMIDSVVRWY